MFLRNCNQKPFTKFLIKKFHWGWTGLGTNQVKESKTETKRQLMGNKGWPKANEERECVQECVGCRYEFVFPSSLSWMVFECYSRGYHADFSMCVISKIALARPAKSSERAKNKNTCVEPTHGAYYRRGIYSTLISIYVCTYNMFIFIYVYMYRCKYKHT